MGQFMHPFEQLMVSQMYGPAELKDFRSKLGLTQAEAAHLVLVALPTWRAWEYGRTNVPNSIMLLLTIQFARAKRILRARLPPAVRELPGIDVSEDW